MLVGHDNSLIDGDEYVINGEKCWITNASYARQIIVTAVTGKDEDGKNIISSIIVPTDTPGVTINSAITKKWAYVARIHVKLY